MDLPSGSGSTDPAELPDPPGPSPAAAADSSSSAAAAGGSTSTPTQPPSPQPPSSQPPSRYESQKRRDWNTFLQYLSNHKPPLTLSRCSGAHVIEFLKYLDQFGKTKVHVTGCPYYGQPNPPAPCGCQLKQAWGSLDALIGRLRAAYEENGGKPEMNPFGARAVRMYLREVRESQAKARGIPYEKKRKRPGGSGGGIKVSVGGGDGGYGGGEGGGDGGDGGGGGGGDGGDGGGEGGGDGGDGGGGGGTGDSSTPATSTI